MKNTASLITMVVVSTIGWAAPVAGLQPDQRPAGAPVMTATAQPGPMALNGVSNPVPESIVKFMRDQGNWYTPFIHPGMTGPYDIRRWHSNSRPSSKP